MYAYIRALRALANKPRCAGRVKGAPYRLVAESETLPASDIKHSFGWFLSFLCHQVCASESIRTRLGLSEREGRGSVLQCSSEQCERGEHTATLEHWVYILQFKVAYLDGFNG